MATVIGLATYAGAVAGLELQDCTEGESASTVAPMKENGDIDTIGVYAKKKTINFNGNITGSSLAVSVGAELTVNGTSYTITSVQKKEAVGQPASCSGTGEAPWSAES